MAVYRCLKKEEQKRIFENMPGYINQHEMSMRKVHLNPVKLV